MELAFFSHVDNVWGGIPKLLAISLLLALDDSTSCIALNFVSIETDLYFRFCAMAIEMLLI
jgi:hypothetical protein